AGVPQSQRRSYGVGSRGTALGPRGAVIVGDDASRLGRLGERRDRVAAGRPDVVWAGSADCIKVGAGGAGDDAGDAALGIERPGGPVVMQDDGARTDCPDIVGGAAPDARQRAGYDLPT